MSTVAQNDVFDVLCEPLDSAALHAQKAASPLYSVSMMIRSVGRLQEHFTVQYMLAGRNLADSSQTHPQLSDVKLSTDPVSA